MEMKRVFFLNEGWNQDKLHIRGLFSYLVWPLFTLKKNESIKVLADASPQFSLQLYSNSVHVKPDPPYHPLIISVTRFCMVILFSLKLHFSS